MQNSSKNNNSTGSSKPLLPAVLNYLFIIEILSFAGLCIYAIWEYNETVQKLIGTDVVLFLTTLLFAAAHRHSEEHGR